MKELKVLSRNSAKHLLARNASQVAILTEKTRRLDKEKSNEERVFLRKKEHVLLCQSRISDLIRLKSSCSNFKNAPLKFHEEKIWRSETSLFDKKRGNLAHDLNNDNRSTSSMLLGPTSINRFIKSTTKTRINDAIPEVSLPCIHKPGNSRRKKKTNPSKIDQKRFSLRRNSLAWQDLRKCRYLRTWNCEKE